MPFGRVHPVTMGGRCPLARLRERVARAIHAAALFAAVGLVFGNGYASAASPGEHNLSYLSIADRVQIAESVPVPAQRREPPGHAGSMDWNGDNFFGPCRADCAISLY